MGIIKRNNSKQIISYTDGDYGEVTISGDTTVFDVDDYNRTIDGLSDELLMDTPDTTPRIVSSNFVDKELIFTEDDLTKVSMRLAGAGTNIRWDELPLVFTLIPGGKTPRHKIIWNFGLMAASAQSSGEIHALYPSNFIDAHKYDVYYRPPLEIGTQIYGQGTDNEPIKLPQYVGDNNAFFAIESFDFKKDTRLTPSGSTDLSVRLDFANPRFLQQFHHDMINAKDVLVPPSPSMAAAGVAFNDHGLSAYNNTDFTGGIIEVDSDGQVVQLWRIEKEYTGGTHFNGPGVWIDIKPKLP